MIFKFLTSMLIAFIAANAASARTIVGQDSSWQRIAPVGRSFTVSMPKPATQDFRLISLNDNDRIPAAIFRVITNGKRFIAAELYRQTSDVGPMSSYEKFTAGMVHTFEAGNGANSIIFLRDLSFPGLTGKEYALRLKDYSGVARFLNAKERFYALIVVGADENDRDATRFFSSFQIGEVNSSDEASGVSNPKILTLGSRTETPTTSAAPTTSVAPVEAASTDEPPEPWPQTVAPISGGVLNGKAIELVRPVYPPEARANHDAGQVRVQIVIDELGRVIAAKALDGPETLREAAVRAASLSRFAPTRLMGQPVRVAGVIIYNFVTK